eukprot:CAMPEP_0181507328 /NCGR_PEP_ID=MMETSP1110-20121109/59089_1 /TAXON_ID=174948 /ORGANISM="Symbiodinium sp., Strain CCMP421" /LENGTH=31 /DNA_ID= /DNA_START= /DNA_END= /DNA_ORIENTATION=
MEVNSQLLRARVSGAGRGTFEAARARRHLAA